MTDIARATALVRPARPADRDAIVELIATMGGHDDITDGADPLAGLTAMIVAPACRVLVAECDARVVGVATLEARRSLLRDRREAWLGVLAVAPALRSRAIGAALLDAAEREAERLGCAALVLETSLVRERAQAFYVRNGFGERAPARRFERPVRVRDGSLADRFLAAAARAATRVAAAIAGSGRAAAIGIGADGAPTEAADAAAERAALAELLPLGIPIVSEEVGLVGAAALDPMQPWISLDPLDGSRNFVNGYPMCSTSMGLVQNGCALAGFVADLAGNGSRWEARAGSRALRDGRPIATRRGELAGAPSPVGRGASRHPLPGFSRLRISGSTVADLCRVADGSLAAFFALDRAVVHVHDLAASFAIIEAAGGCVIDRNGGAPVLVPDAATCLEIVAACDRETALLLVQNA